jgi:hypothetical protein
MAMKATTACFAAVLSLAAAICPAIAQTLPAAGRYQCVGPSGAMNSLTFTVGPGNIYTTRWGWRGVLAVHPGTGNILFLAKTPESAYEGLYSPGPPPQVTLVTAADGKSTDTGIVCKQ